MSASKKRRKLPDEDLAAAVADIINSPITRPNLSFLRQPPSSSLERTSDLNVFLENSTTDKSNAAPPGFESSTLDSEAVVPALPEPSEVFPKRLDEQHHSSIPPQADIRRSTEFLETPLRPIGFESRPPGFTSIPAGSVLNASELVEKSPLPEGPSTDAGQWEPQASTLPLWQAEGLTALFEQSRVKRIRQAQDALSLVEEKVYDLLWGAKNQQKDEFRLVHYSLQRMANEARINIKTVRELIPRLIEKGFLRIEHEADVRRNIPTLYRVFSYSSVLNRQRQRNRFYVVKTGKGVFYVHPVSAALRRREDSHAETSKPGGLDLWPIGFSPRGLDAKPVGHDPDPNPSNTIGPVGLSSPKPMGATGQLSIDSLEDKYTRQMSSSTWARLGNSIRGSLGLEADDQLLRTMITACHRNAVETTGQPATEEELIYFTTSKASILSRTPNIRNHLAVLRKAVPECFLGETFRAYRLAAEAQKLKQSREEQDQQDRQTELERSAQQEQARYALWSAVSERHRSEQGYDMQAILNDPDLDDRGREQARGMLQRLGRYTRSGI